MPRREAFDADTGDDGLAAAPDRIIPTTTTTTMNHLQLLSGSQQHQRQQQQPHHNNNNNYHEEDPDLVELERQLNEQVDEDLFEEPRTFNTLHRVIDVLGLHMLDDAASLDTSLQDLGRSNPAYKNLKVQQTIVEDAIEHMAVLHCADLNGSVIQVGRVARQFSQAVLKVRTLRHNVRHIQDTLGAAAAANNNNNNNNTTNNKGGIIHATGGTASAAPISSTAASMSLRELWLKKLECEATLSLLDKLNVIRAAPSRFDQLIHPVPACRIGAAVLTLSQALETMFCDDVAQVQALHKIMEQLLLRKQRAEEIIWDTLYDVIYLRTANGLVPIESKQQQHAKKQDKATSVGGSGSVNNKNTAPNSSQQSVSSRDSRLRRVDFRNNNNNMTGTTSSSVNGMKNPFLGKSTRYALDQDLDDQSETSEASGASLFSMEEDWDEETSAGNNMNTSGHQSSSGASVGSKVGGGGTRSMLIPVTMVEAELDLEMDERRCLEEYALSAEGVAALLTNNNHVASLTHRQRQLPRYADPVLALRLLAECVAQLKRLDDVERVLHEGLEREIRNIIQREQARTFARLERKRNHLLRHPNNNNNKVDLTDFRRHLTGLLSAFGCVMIRMTHLAEILRFRISADRELVKSIEDPSSIMRSVLSAAFTIMQREVKEFLKACLIESEAPNDPLESMAKRSGGYESGLFSLGIVDAGAKTNEKSTATRTNVMEMSATKFVTTVLFPKTKNEPQARHALSFRRSVARWTSENEALKRELGMLTGEDTSAPSFRNAAEETAIGFLDGVIQKDLLPVLQEEAVNGTVGGLERRDAFDPVLDRTLYARPNSNEPQDVEMCFACQAMYDSSGPLFLALHRLPKGGDMYLPLVAVLEHVMLTFTSRVKQQIQKICQTKTASNLLKDDSKSAALASLFERRKPFQMLVRTYADSELLDASFATEEANKHSAIAPLPPPSSDTVSRQNVNDFKAETPMEDLADDVDGEELVLEQEVVLMKAFFDFGDDNYSSLITVCSDEELMKASCLGHSLLKLASLLESRLKVRGGDGSNKSLTSTRTLREAIKTIKASGTEMAKFCRLDMLMQAVTRLSKICRSSTLVATDAVRIPSSVNDLGEYLTSASDNLREAAGNAFTAYTFSSLEQYIPVCLMETVRVVATGKGIIAKAPLTMNGIEALDRSGSVLYRDLKGSTSFDNSFWDVELAAISFERSASFMAMMELEMEELVAYYSANKDDFSEKDFELIFAMNGPRRRGDIGRLHMLNRRRR